MDEFDLIQRYFHRPLNSSQCVLGVGDDAALIQPTTGKILAVSADTLLEGRHFFADVEPYKLGWKALAVNLSDMAAMGATPKWFTLCLTLPRINETWLSAFSDGLYSAANLYGVALVGGDTTSGPLSISIQILGEVAPKAILRRDGAKAGDDIWLSGATGAAAMAVAHRKGLLVLRDEDLAHACDRLDLPLPRVELGIALGKLANAAIDISDGLVADVGHIASRSGVQARVWFDQIPLPAFSSAALVLPQCHDACLGGGDDYELCFTASPNQRAAIAALAAEIGVPLTRIGEMTAGSGVEILNAEGHPLTSLPQGFNHFS